MLENMFASGKYDLPIVLKKGDAKRRVFDTLSSYISDLNAHGARKEIIDQVRSFRRSCSFTLSNCFKGIHSRAYENFSNAVERLGIGASPLLSSTLGNDPLFR